jgi:hypothetical protein
VSNPQPQPESTPAPAPKPDLFGMELVKAVTRQRDLALNGVAEHEAENVILRSAVAELRRINENLAQQLSDATVELNKLKAAAAVKTKRQR